MSLHAANPDRRDSIESPPGDYSIGLGLIMPGAGTFMKIS
jgi:hypothetical protein